MNDEQKELPNLFSAKLRYYMDKTGLTGEKIADKMDINKSTVIHWSNGRRFPRDILKISELADILGVSMIDLLPVTHKEKAKLVRKELTENIEDYEDYMSNTLPRSLLSIPLVDGYVGAGSTGLVSKENIDHIYVDIHSIDIRFQKKQLQAIQVVGDSMKPYINDSDIALFIPIESGEKLTDGKYIISTPQGEQLKNIKFMLNGNLRIISENPSYHNSKGYDEEINKDSQEFLTIVGRVVGRILKG